MKTADRIAEIEAQMADLRESNAHWKRCQDGSYEMALDVAGYWKLHQELQELKSA